MITEDYVSFEVAKLLRENGFDVETYASIKVFANHNYEVNGERITPEKDTIIPTLQMAMKWLREVHDIYIMIDKDFATEKGWHYVVVRKQDWVNNIDNGLTQQESNSYTYEFACEAAIMYCLENLI